MLFNYQDSYSSGIPEGYETLLLDVIEGDATLFMRADQVEAAWQVITPILEMWRDNPSVNFPNYSAHRKNLFVPVSNLRATIYFYSCQNNLMMHLMTATE